MYYNYSDFKSIISIKENINQNQKEYNKNLKVNLPDIITDGKDLFIQKSQKTKINFISNKIINSKVVEFRKVNLKKLIQSFVLRMLIQDLIFVQQKYKRINYEIWRAKLTYGNKMCRIKFTSFDWCWGRKLYKDNK